jgi:hypothetical protein
VITGVSMKAIGAAKICPPGGMSLTPVSRSSNAAPLTRTMSEEHQERPMLLSAMT